jgi:hypothetical protein
MRHIVICDLPLYNIFPHYLIKSTIFEKQLLNIKHMFQASLQLLSEVCFILRISERYIIENMYNVCFCVKYPWFLFNYSETLIFSTDFRKILQYQIPWKSVQWEPSCSKQTDGRTDMMKLRVAFHNFTNAPNNALGGGEQTAIMRIIENTFTGWDKFRFYVFWSRWYVYKSVCWVE